MSVVVATRDRGATVVPTVQALLTATSADLEVIVADQSETRSTLEALGPLLGDARLRYLPTGSCGVAAGRNTAIRMARRALVAVTDDDCGPVAGWLEALNATLAEDSRVGLAFGSVEAGPHDRAIGTVPAFVVHGAFLARGMGDRHLIRGLGPCLLMRRTTWEALSGFDEALGAGARFRAGELPDFVLRAIRAGHWVAGTPRARVIHHGFRRWPEARELLRAYCYGGGALWAKHLRWVDPGMAGALLRIGWRWAAGHSPVARSVSPHAARGRRLAWFVRGFLAGASTPVDGATGHYVVRRP